MIVCAQSNTAVDCISEKLVDRGINVLRIGNPTRINDKMLSFTYERRFESHPDYPELWSIRKAIRDIQSICEEKPGGTGYDPKPPLPFEIPGDRTGSQDRYRAVRRGSCCRLHLGWLRKPGHDEPALHDLIYRRGRPSLGSRLLDSDRQGGPGHTSGRSSPIAPTIKCIEAEREGLGRTLMQR